MSGAGWGEDVFVVQMALPKIWLRYLFPPSQCSQWGKASLAQQGSKDNGLIEVRWARRLVVGLDGARWSWTTVKANKGHQRLIHPPPCSLGEE